MSGRNLAGAKVLFLHPINADLSRWKLVLGSDSDPEDAIVLNNSQDEADELLNAIYGTTKNLVLVVQVIKSANGWMPFDLNFHPISSKSCRKML